MSLKAKYDQYTSFYTHVHVLFSILNVSLNFWCDVESQFLRHGQRNHGRADHLYVLPVEKM